MKDKAVLVFLSGWAAGPEVWLEQEQYFTSCDTFKISYHLGIDAPFAEQQSFSLYARAAIEAINRECDSRVILAGWSLGALVALELALLAPERIQALIIAGGTGRFTSAEGYDGGLRAVLAERMQKKLARNPEQTLHEFYSQMFTAREHEEGLMEQFLKIRKMVGLNWSQNELAGGLDYLLTQDLRESLGEVKAPAIILHGTDDWICSEAAGRYLHARLGCSQLHLLPGCGHMPFLSSAKVFNELVGRWLDDLF